jgi:very-short-patch-repair endonuclease
VVESHAKTRGIAMVRRALPLVSTRSASPLESSTRLVAVRDAGYRGVRVNEPVFDLGGRLLGIADLLDVERGIVVETDGDDHAVRSRRTRDNRRQEEMTRAGLVTVRVTADDHRDRRRLAARLARIRRETRPGRDGAWTLDRPPWWWTWAPGRRWD